MFTLRQLISFPLLKEIMSRSVKLAGRLLRQVGIPVADLPVFLCPGILRFPSLSTSPLLVESRPQRLQASQQRYVTSITPASVTVSPKLLVPLLEKLPQQCPGCGALSQIADKDAPGFYTPTRKSIRRYLEGGSSSSKKSAEDEIIRAALENAVLVETGISVADFSAPS